MYLFSRRTRLASPDGLEWAAEIAGKSSEVAGIEVNLWGTVYSAGFGTVSWTAWFENLAALEAAGDALNGNEDYQKLTAIGRDHTDGTMDDALNQLLAGTPNPDRDVQYVGSVTAVIAGGGFERGMTTGVGIAELASKITGLDTLFARGMTGPYGGIGWLTGYESITEFEAAQNALAADESWMKYLDGTEGVFAEEPALTVATMYRKLA